MEGKPDPQGAQGGEAMETNAFGSLAIWREKLSSDLGDLSSTAGRPNNKLRLLLEQGKGKEGAEKKKGGAPPYPKTEPSITLPADVEQAVLGCLKDSLWELREGVEWGLLDEGFAGRSGFLPSCGGLPCEGLTSPPRSLAVQASSGSSCTTTPARSSWTASSSACSWRARREFCRTTAPPSR